MTLTKREPVSVKFRRFRALSFYSVTVLLIFSPCASAVTVAANVPQYGFQVLPGSIRQINVNITGGTGNLINWTVEASTGGATATLDRSTNSIPLVTVTIGAVGGTCSIIPQSYNGGTVQGWANGANTFDCLLATPRQTHLAGLTNAVTPTTGSTVYSSPISISVSETVQAIVTATGYAASTVGSAAYTIGSSSPVYVQKCNNFEAWGTGVSCTLTGVGAGHALMIGVYGGTLTSVTSSAAAHPRV